MPQTLIVIFLLFFAVLAFGWFYWQRAKARDAEPAAATPAGGDAAAATDAPAMAEQGDTTDTTPAS